jgi:hypothetical protein
MERRRALFGAVVVAGVLALPTVARAGCSCDDDDSGTALPWEADRGDAAVGRRANQTWSQFYDQNQRWVEREYGGRRR